jgi:hypothetical protein
LKYRSNVKNWCVPGFLGYDFLYPGNTIFALKLPVLKIFGIPEPYEQILERTTQGTFLQKNSFLGIIVSQKKIFKELLMLIHMPNTYTYELS